MKRQKLLPYLLSFFFLFLAAGNLFAQQVSNISFKQEGDKVVISYDLSGSAGDLFNTTAFYSIDDGKTWTQLVTVTGDLVNVNSGSGKKIYWEVLKDVTGIKGSISFKVEATKSKEKTYIKNGLLLAGELLGIKVGYEWKKWGVNGTFFYHYRGAGYISVTRNLISKEKFKWNIGPSVGIGLYRMYDPDYSYDSNYTIDYWGFVPGLTNEFQLKRLFFNADILFSINEELTSQFIPSIGFGFVF